MAQAIVLRAQNRFNEAIRTYDAVLTLNRNFVPAYAKLSAGSTEGAIPLLEEAIQLSPRNSDVGSWYRAIGRAHLMEARIDQAAFWLEKARSANPGQGPHLHAWLASAYALEGGSERAAAELAEARRLGSDDRYSSISRLRASIYRGAEGPGPPRSHLFRRAAQGRHAGRVTAAFCCVTFPRTFPDPVVSIRRLISGHAHSTC